MKDLSLMTDDAVLAELGDRMAQSRLSRNLTQAELAREAGVHKNTIYRLEAGGSTQLTNLVRVLRALSMLGNLDALVPPPAPSPLEQLKSKSRSRKRATPSTPPREAAAEEAWSWNDEEADNAHQQQHDGDHDTDHDHSGDREQQ